MDAENTVICRLVRKGFQVNDVVIRRNETNYQHNGRVTKPGTYVSVFWRHTGDIIETPATQLMLYQDWLDIQKRQEQLKNYWNLSSTEQQKIRGE